MNLLKRNTPELTYEAYTAGVDLEAEVEHTTYIEGQDTPIVVRGFYNDSMDQLVRADIEAYNTAQKAQTNKETPKAVKPATAPRETPELVYTEPSRRERVAQYMRDAKLRKFDKVHGTDLYAELQEKRRKTAIFMVASEYGLFDRDSDYYKSQLRRMAKG